MNEVVCVIEHQSIPIIKDRKPGDIALSNKHADVLERMTNIPADAYSWGRDFIKWNNYCGLISLGDITLEVLPKINDVQHSVNLNRSALIRMLKSAGVLKLYKPGAAEIELASCGLLDVFIFDFCEQVAYEISRGAAKRYVSIEENLGVFRGKLKIEQQIKTNLVHREKLYCEYDELSEDNILNQAIRYALELVSKKSFQSRIKKLISELIIRFDHISKVNLSADQVAAIELNRNENRFNGILKYCEMFVRSLAPINTSGKHQVFSLLFDMNQLFEAWVCAQLKPLAHEMGFVFRTQGPRKYLAYREDIQSEVFQMKPDIALLDEANRVALIADAKWKVLSEEEKKLGVSQADMYQLSAYGSRYKSSSLALIYPMSYRSRKSYRMNLNAIENPAPLLITTCGTQQVKDSSFLNDIRLLLNRSYM